MRCEEEGWNLIGIPDPSGRRGLWVRITDDQGVICFKETDSEDEDRAKCKRYFDGPHQQVELCAGREGDDSYLSLRPGQELTAKDLWRLVDVVTTLRFAFEQGEEPCKKPGCETLVWSGRSYCDEHYWNPAKPPPLGDDE